MDQLEFFVVSQHFEVKRDNDLSIESVGQKALGLFSCPKELTPPFFVVVSSLYRFWISHPEQAKAILKDVLQAVEELFKNEKLDFIVRSSAKHESFEEKGYYESSSGGINFSDLYDEILSIWSKNEPYVKEHPNNEFALIIQSFRVPKTKGHLSNERRINFDLSKWLIEITNNNDEFLSSRLIKSNEALELKSDAHNNLQVIECLKTFAFFYFNQAKRVHIEWVWDGKKVWIVQVDIENDIEEGDEPGSQWKIQKTIIESSKLKCFMSSKDSGKNWRKTVCIKTFKDCHLPAGEIYILENENYIQNLGNCIIDEEIQMDVEWLCKYPIIIRMDVAKADGYNNILLPRTETMFSKEDAIRFLCQKSKEFLNAGLLASDFCFLIHRFILSKSCALAFSKPNISKTRIDSTWGIVDGLYFHSHDTFEVSLNQKASIKKQIRCKTEYLDVDSCGNWFSKNAGSKFDWSPSLNRKQILEIAGYNIAIADYLDRPVTVMYFVDVDRSTGYPHILPWFYTTDEISDRSEKFTDVIFSEKRELLETADDFQRIKSLAQADGKKFSIKLKLHPDLIREKGFIENIGTFAAEHNIPIEVEGSMLAHTYYILKKQNARVKCLGSFEPKYKQQKFYKLVRDKIPISIRQKGEQATTLKIDPQNLLKFLKEKAIEEAFEFFWESEDDKIIEEMADIYEILRSACKIFGIQFDELVQIADKKSEKKGGFESGIVLVDTRESPLIDIVDGNGDSLLPMNEDEEKPLNQLKKRKSKKIAFSADNSTITLPYFIRETQIENIMIPLNLEQVQLLKLKYTNNGIVISFEQKKKDVENNQLSLFTE